MNQADKWQRISRLALAVFLLAGCWLVLLPILGRQPIVQAQLNWLEEQRINPGAMYYTELESFEPVLDRLNRQQRRR